jgi:hypothetical protein
MNRFSPRARIPTTCKRLAISSEVSTCVPMSKWSPFLRFTNAKNPLPWVIYAMGTDRCTLGDGNLQARPPRIAKGRIATFKAYPKGFPAPLARFGGVFGQLFGGKDFPFIFRFWPSATRSVAMRHEL